MASGASRSSISTCITATAPRQPSGTTPRPSTSRPTRCPLYPGTGAATEIRLVRQHRQRPLPAGHELGRLAQARHPPHSAAHRCGTAEALDDLGRVRRASRRPLGPDGPDRGRLRLGDERDRPARQPALRGPGGLGARGRLRPARPGTERRSPISRRWRGRPGRQCDERARKPQATRETAPGAWRRSASRRRSPSSRPSSSGSSAASSTSRPRSTPTSAAPRSRRHCAAKLREAQLRVEKITFDKDGKPRLEPVDDA